jgi:hypothetical protein
LFFKVCGIGELKKFGIKATLIATYSKLKIFPKSVCGEKPPLRMMVQIIDEK